MSTSSDIKELDARMRALVIEMVQITNHPVILHQHLETQTYVVADYFATRVKGSDRPAGRVEYQVSNGLPGDRTSSVDEYTYSKARKEFAEAIETEKARQAQKLRSL